MNPEPIIPRRGLGAETDAEMEAWLSRHRRDLVRTAVAILHDRDQAEDVNALKHRARRRSDVSLEAIDPGSLAQPAREDFGLGPMELERAIGSLPVTQQTVIRLRFYLGLSFREIGQNLLISTNTAASRTRYALRRLRQLLRRPPAETRRSPS